MARPDQDHVPSTRGYYLLTSHNYYPRHIFESVSFVFVVIDA